MEPIIQIKDLSFGYSKNEEVFRNITLTINSSEIVGIIGKSGSGKSTLCYTIKGIIPHIFRGKLTGNIIVDGIDVLHEIGLGGRGPGRQGLGQKHEAQQCGCDANSEQLPAAAYPIERIHGLNLLEPLWGTRVEVLSAFATSRVCAWERLGLSGHSSTQGIKGSALMLPR